MIVFFAVLCLLCIPQIKFAREGEYHPDYLLKDSTTAVNGFFVALVFLSHFKAYFELSGVYDKPFNSMMSFLNQLIVTTFLFYSGYGIMCSINKKGIPYVKSIPKKRFLSVLLHFDIAVMLYFVLNIILQKKMQLKTVLLSLVGWDSLGNSNWYIFAILILYIFVFISFMAVKDKKLLGVMLTAVFSCLYVCVMTFSEKKDFFYNTVMCYPVGMIYGLYKEKIEKFLQKSNVLYFGSLFLLFSVFFFFSLYGIKGAVIYQLWSISFVLFLVVLSMKIKVDNAFLRFFGKRIFEIYLLQRIPMIILKETSLVKFPYLCLIFSLLFTLLLSEIFSLCMKNLDRKLRLC